MPHQYSGAIRDAQANQIETIIGASPKIEIFTGTKPADCAAVDSGTKIASGTLPSDWLTAASGGNGQVAKNGTWTITGLTAAGSGQNMGYFRIKDASGTTTHIQGSITVTGGGGEMTVTNTNVADGQNVTVTSFSITRGNA